MEECFSTREQNNNGKKFRYQPNLKLKRERELRGWSQTMVAENIGSQPRLVTRWEMGDTFPSPYYRQKLCHLFEKNAEELGLIKNDDTNTVRDHISSPLNLSEEAATEIADDPVQIPMQRSHHERFFSRRTAVLFGLLGGAEEYSPDESRVASAGANSTVQVWNPTDGSRWLTYRGHTGSVVYLAWSHNGTHIASAGRDSTVQVWDAFTGEQISIYRGHQQTVWSLRWSPDDNSIVSGGEDGILHIWQPTGTKPSPTFVYQGPQLSTINEVDWSPNGLQVASAHDDGCVYLWDALIGGLIFTYRGHTTAVITTRWSPDGIWIASGGSDDTVQIWKVPTGKQLLTYHKNTKDILELSWSSDGQHIAFGSKDLMVYIYHT